jgi:hypothetical protein
VAHLTHKIRTHLHTSAKEKKDVTPTIAKASYRSKVAKAKATLARRSCLHFNCSSNYVQGSDFCCDEHQNGHRIAVTAAGLQEKKRMASKAAAAAAATAAEEDAVVSYLKVVKEANKSIKDSLSRESLDITMQCVNISVAATQQGQDEGAISFVQRRLAMQHSQILKPATSKTSLLRSSSWVRSTITTSSAQGSSVWVMKI